MRKHLISTTSNINFNSRIIWFFFRSTRSSDFSEHAVYIANPSWFTAWRLSASLNARRTVRVSSVQLVHSGANVSRVSGMNSVDICLLFATRRSFAARPLSYCPEVVESEPRRTAFSLSPSLETIRFRADGPIKNSSAGISASPLQFRGESERTGADELQEVSCSFARNALLRPAEPEKYFVLIKLRISAVLFCLWSYLQPDGVISKKLGLSFER